jgi:hypothetical protein
MEQSTDLSESKWTIQPVKQSFIQSAIQRERNIPNPVPLQGVYEVWNQVQWIIAACVYSRYLEQAYGNLFLGALQGPVWRGL